DGIRDWSVTGVQTCALPIYAVRAATRPAKPTAIAANGSAHHQCSEKAARPWLLSRPDANRPRTMRSAATACAERLICPEGSAAKIGRASCRERGEVWEGDGV